MIADTIHMHARSSALDTGQVQVRLARRCEVCARLPWTANLKLASLQLRIQVRHLLCELLNLCLQPAQVLCILLLLLDDRRPRLVFLVNDLLDCLPALIVNILHPVRCAVQGNRCCQHVSSRS